MRVIEGERAGKKRVIREARVANAREERWRRVKKRRRAAALAGLLLALALVAVVLSGPFSRYLESKRELSRTESQLAEERAKTQVLEERRNRALTDEYIEGEARRMGYVKPGEIPLIILDEKDQEGREPDGEGSSP